MNMKPHHHRSPVAGGLCLVALLVLSAPWSRAGHTTEVDYTAMSIEQLMEIPVYAASKHEQRTADAPSSVTIVPAQDIRSYGWRTLADLLRSVPGLYVSHSRSYGLLGVRGFGRPNDFGGRTLLLVNGHRLNDALYDTAATLNDFILDLDVIDRVEIVRGPGSALYGNNAFFAVVNVITRIPIQVNGTEVSADYGAYDAFRGRVTHGAVHGKTEMLISASGFWSEGDRRIYVPSYDAPETNHGVVQDGDGEWARSLFVSVRQGAYALQGGYVGRDKDVPLPAYGTVFGRPRNTFDGRGFGEVRWEAPVSDDVTALVRLYYDWYEYRGKYWYDGAEEGEPQRLFLNRDRSVNEALGGEVQARWQASRRQGIAMGAEYRYDFRNLMRNYDDLNPRVHYLDIDPAIRSYAFYAQDEYRLLTNLTFTAGVRYDNFDTFGDTINPRLACVYSPFRSMTLKFLFGRAFRAPNVNEFYYEDDGLTSKVNPDLKPEKVTTYELVCEQRFGPRWRGSVAGFYNHVDDLINAVEDPADGLYYSDNIDQAEARGLEFSADGQMTDRIRLRASYTLTDTEDKATGEPLSNSPRHLAKFNATSPLWSDRLMAGVEAQYVGDREDDEGESADDLWLVNLTVFTRRIANVWELSASVYNVFDTRYCEPGALADAEGRTFRVKATCRF
jgi:outer membrane receptor for ferrienterochelin and colicins